MSFSDALKFAQAISESGDAAVTAFLALIIFLLLLVCTILWRMHQSNIKQRFEAKDTNAKMFHLLNMGMERLTNLQSKVNEHSATIAEHGEKLIKHEERIKVLDKYQERANGDC